MNGDHDWASVVHKQTRDENELGTEWRIERIGVDVTRSYFGDFRFGDFFFNSPEYKNR